MKVALLAEGTQTHRGFCQLGGASGRGDRTYASMTHNFALVDALTQMIIRFRFDGYPDVSKIGQDWGTHEGELGEVYFERNLSQTGDRRISQYHKYGLLKDSGFLDAFCFLGYSYS